MGNRLVMMSELGMFHMTDLKANLLEGLFSF